MKKFKGISLFASGGVGEMNLSKYIDFKLANELLPVRAKAHKFWHPNTEMLCGDIKGFDIVALRSEVLGAYCYKECQYSKDGYADFTTLRRIARNNSGTDITQAVYDLTMRRYGIGSI